MGKWVSSPAYRAVIQVLVEARKAKGLSQREVAALMGKHYSFIAKSEAGERHLDLVEFVAIARAVGADVKELLVAAADAMPERLDV